jgi:branched-chain amino acid transport system substrate-binding protein
MKLAGSVTDATAIRAKLSEAFKTMPRRENMFGVSGVDATGSSEADGRAAVVEDGKIREVLLNSLK